MRSSRFQTEGFSYTQPLLGETKSGFTLRTDLLIGWLAKQRLAGENTRKLAYAFHFVLAGMVCKGCKCARRKTGLSSCALSGGVFQNRLFTSLCAGQLRKAGFRVLLHSMVPPNDGGTSLGQAVAAMYQLNRKIKN